MTHEEYVRDYRAHATSEIERLRAEVVSLRQQVDDLRRLHAAACDRIAEQAHLLSRRAEGTIALLHGPIVEIDYTNHQGERRFHLIRPLRLWYGETPWQPDAQYFLTASDLETPPAIAKEFALTGLHGWRQLPVE